MARSFDTWNRYVDNNGNPLHGCIQFMVKDGTTVAPIFDADKVPLDNPQITDEYGRTEHQVFIKEDVRAYFYAYIGDGIWNTQEDIDTSDQTLWALQYTIENQEDINVSIESTGALCVPTVSALRNLNIDTVPEVAGVKVITLLGYYNLGDKEPINYYWDAESEESDDDGSVIKYTGEITGRWIMVQPTEHCDSRHFGVFPSNSYNMEDQTYGINKLFEYCNNKSLRPFFNGGGDYKWFKYTNINVTSAFIDVSEGTKFYDTGTSTITGEWNGDPSFVNRNTNVVAKNVKTSWTAKSYTGYENVIIDANTNQTNWQNAHIDTRLNPTFGFNFNNCTFAENRNLGSHNGGNYNTFTNCNLTAKMFITSGANATSLVNGKAVNCTFDINDWNKSEEDLYYYIQLRLTNDANPNLDFQGTFTGNRPFINYAGGSINSAAVSLSNFNTSTVNPLTIVRLNDTYKIVLNNCTGKFNLNNWGNGTVVEIKNCVDVEITNIANKATLVIENSSVVVSESDTLQTLSLRNSTFVSTSDDVVFNCSEFSCWNSILSVSIYCNNAVIKDTQINKHITVEYDDQITCSAFIDNNIFNEVLELKGKDGTYNHVVNTSIVNNTGHRNSPIMVNRTYLDRVEANHHYTYEGNIGSFVPKFATANCDITLLDDAREFTGSEWTWHLDGGQYGPKYSYMAISTYYNDDGTAYYRHNYKFPFAPVNLFRIGTDDAVVDVEWNWNYWTAGYAVLSDNIYNYMRIGISPVKFQACAKYTGSGDQFKIVGLWRGPNDVPTPGSINTSQSQSVAVFNPGNSITVLGTGTLNCDFKLTLV